MTQNLERVLGYLISFFIYVKILGTTLGGTTVVPKVTKDNHPLFCQTDCGENGLEIKTALRPFRGLRVLGRLGSYISAQKSRLCGYLFFERKRGETADKKRADRGLTQTEIGAKITKV